MNTLEIQKFFNIVHCTRYQKVTSSAHASNIIIDPEQFKWLSGEELVGRYEMKEAKHFATSFCNKCGSSLPWLTQSKKAYVVPAGTLDDDPEIKPIHNIYVGNKAPWYEVPNSLVEYDELPVKK